ncbi:hypothetical protein MHYP_G00092870 [Metynnis hypsauchen]
MAEHARAGASSATANSYNTRARTLAGGGEDHPGPTQRTSKTTLNKPMSQAVLQWKNKVEVFQDRIEELEAENSFLKQQLEEQKEGAAHSKKPDGDNISGMQTKDAMTSKSSSESSSEHSFNTSSESDSESESNSTTDEDRTSRKRTRKSKKSKKHKKDKKRKKQQENRMRASNITEVVSRYRNVLRCVQKGYRMSKAFKKAHVSRNGIKHTAAIAEIYFADRTILDEFQGDYKLLDLAKLCESRIVGELASKIIEMKKKKELLPFKM